MQQRDKFKQTVCHNNGITLIVIPYWWDKSIQSVAATIQAVRPDIHLPHDLLGGNVISTIMPVQQQHTLSLKYYGKLATIPPASLVPLGW